MINIDKYNMFTGVGYQATGDLVITNYDDMLYANVGASIPQKSGNQLGVMLNYAQAATPGLDDAREVTRFMNMPLKSKRNLYFYILSGLSDGSSDYGFGRSYHFGYKCQAC